MEGMEKPTPFSLYLKRREFLRLGAGSALSAAAVLGATRRVYAKGEPEPPPLLPDVKQSAFTVEQDKTPFTDVIHYNNYYEFGTSEDDPSANAGGFKTRPWTVSFEGEIAKPQKVSIDDLLKWFPLEERVYRMRCVEAWS